MSKAMLIMDMPESCEKCELSRCLHAKGVGICGVNREHFDDMTKVQAWCPLRKVPKKVDYLIEYFNDGQMSLDLSIGYAKGWNACIDEILGN